MPLIISSMSWLLCLFLSGLINWNGWNIIHAYKLFGGKLNYENLVSQLKMKNKRANYDNLKYCNSNYVEAHENGE